MFYLDHKLWYLILREWDWAYRAIALPAFNLSIYTVWSLPVTTCDWLHFRMQQKCVGCWVMWRRNWQKKWCCNIHTFTYLPTDEMKLYSSCMKAVDQVRLTEWSSRQLQPFEQIPVKNKQLKVMFVHAWNGADHKQLFNKLVTLIFFFCNFFCYRMWQLKLVIEHKLNLAICFLSNLLISKIVCSKRSRRRLTIKSSS